MNVHELRAAPPMAWRPVRLVELYVCSRLAVMHEVWMMYECLRRLLAMVDFAKFNYYWVLPKHGF